jgi:hypothetical protein
MDRMSHELARVRQAEIQARSRRRPIENDLRDYRTANGILRIIRMGRR